MRRVFLSAFLATLAVTANAECVFKGKCGVNAFATQPCVAEGQNKIPQPLESDDLSARLSRVCHDFSERNQPLCCDSATAEVLTESAAHLAVLVAQCPSCYVNLIRLFCQMACSPNQHEFMNVTKWSAVPPTEYGDKKIESIEYYLAEEYINKTYASCTGVQGPQTGSSVMQILCGPYGDQCSPVKLLKFIGSSPYPTPYSIDFRFSAKAPFTLLNGNATKCNESPFNGAFACPCRDCPASCA